jgi:hypothetical protein
MKGGDGCEIIMGECPGRVKSELEIFFPRV